MSNEDPNNTKLEKAAIELGEKQGAEREIAIHNQAIAEFFEKTFGESIRAPLLFSLMQMIQDRRISYYVGEQAMERM